MRYWWVNQNQTFKHEVKGGFLWSPKRNNGGGRNQFYDNMKEVRAGDMVLSFCNTFIKAIGTAQGSAESSTKPEFGTAGSQWSNEGWYVPIEFKLAPNPVRPKDIIADLLPHLSRKYAPLQLNGNGNQGVYLTEVSGAFAEVILDAMGLPVTGNLLVDPLELIPSIHDEDAQIEVQGRTDIGSTHKEQLIRARRGQGVFRANVRLNEKLCRLTGVTDPRFLVASHIKPWRDCNDEEKLDGCNGLLLSPHVDRLFDRGLITFDDDGFILRSTKLPDEIWTAWGLGEINNVGAFSTRQAAYLAHHRTMLFTG